MKTRKKRLWRRLLAGLLLVLCSAPVVLLLLLQTEAGRDRMARWLSLALSSGQRTVRVEKISIPWPTRAAIRCVSVSDPSGLCLTIRDVELQWHPLDLMAGRVKIRRLHVASLDVERLPAAGSGTEPLSPSPLRVPEFCVEAVTLDELRLGACVCGFPAALSGTRGNVQGGARNGDLRVSFNADADRVALGTTVLERVVANLDVSFDRSLWGVSGTVVSRDGLRASGALRIVGEGAWPTGSLQAEVDGAARWAQSLWPGLTSGRFSVSLGCVPRPDDREVLQVRMSADRLRGDKYAVQTAAVQAQLRRTRGQAELSVEGDTHLEGLLCGALSVTGAEIHVSGPWRTISVAGTAGGVFERPFTVDAAGSLEWAKGFWGLALQRATVGWGGVRARLVEPLHARHSGDQTSLSAALCTEAFDLAAVSNATLGALGGHVTAGLRVGGSLAAPEFQGEVSGEALSAQAGVFAGLPSLSGAFTFDCSNGVLRASGEASAPTGGFASAKVQVPARVSLYPWALRLDPDLLTVEAVARLGSFSTGALTVTGAEIHVSGPWRSAAVAATAGGVFKRPFAMDAAGHLRCEGNRMGLELQHVAVGWAGVQARLVEPLVLRASGDQTAITAAWRAESLDLASISNALPRALSGRVAAALRVRGTLAAPEFDGSVTCEGLSMPSGVFAHAPVVTGVCEFDYSNCVLRASAQAHLPTGGMANVTVRAPLQVSLQPWVLHLDRDRDLSVAIEAGLNLAVLNGLDAFANGRVGGRLDLSVAHVGTVSSGTVTGTCVLADGDYENYVLGTVIRKARVLLVARDDGLVIESGSATDGGKGRLTLGGRVRLHPADGLPYVFDLGCRKARLVRRPDTEATLSGKLTLAGTVSHIRAEGDVQVENALVELQNVRPSPPVTLEPLPAAEPRVATRRPSGTNVTLRLAVAIPGSLYIRSRTLDSAWAGNLVFEYADDACKLSGTLEPRRGTVLLLKRPFKLTEGQIAFDGRWLPDPALRLTASYSRPDLIAHVSVVGRAHKPEVVLTSEPSLPEDEILARILFGKEMSTVTPLQALSLASEAAKLRKIGGGTGLLDDMQTAVGIDRLEFTESGEKSAAPEVAAGKYLGDRSYVEMRRTTSTEQSGRMRLYLEHELRPSIVIEAESGLEMRSGLGLFWRRDY